MHPAVQAVLVGVSIGVGVKLVWEILIRWRIPIRSTRSRIDRVHHRLDAWRTERLRARVIERARVLDIELFVRSWPARLDPDVTVVELADGRRIAFLNPVRLNFPAPTVMSEEQITRVLSQKGQVFTLEEHWSRENMSSWREQHPVGPSQ